MAHAAAGRRGAGGGVPAPRCNVPLDALVAVRCTRNKTMRDDRAPDTTASIPLWTLIPWHHGVLAVPVMRTQLFPCAAAYHVPPLDPWDRCDCSPDAHPLVSRSTPAMHTQASEVCWVMRPYTLHVLTPCCPSAPLRSVHPAGPGRRPPA